MRNTFSVSAFGDRNIGIEREEDGGLGVHGPPGRRRRQGVGEGGRGEGPGEMGEIAPDSANGLTGWFP